MTRLSIAAGPPVALPLAFLAAVPAWGIASGVLLAIEGTDALATRWGPSTLALVHGTTLGILGNAVTGALLQFLPAAAGTTVRGGVRAGVALFTSLQVGTLALVAGFHAMHPGLLTAGSACLVLAFSLLAACVIPGLIARREALHRGIAGAVGALLVAAVLGAAMALAIAGQLPGPSVLPWADVHAAWGLLGGMLVLLAAVGQVVLPMFQAVAAQPDARHAAWRMAVGASLVFATGALAAGHPRLAAYAVAGCVGAWSVSLLCREAKAERRRAAPLRSAWVLGALALLAAAATLAAGAPATLTGALVLALGLPLPVLSMLMEIVAFLVWIDLQRRAPRGRRVPAVQALLPARMRGAAVAAFAVAGAGVVLATQLPMLAPYAGLALAGAHALLLSAVLAAAFRRRLFLSGARSV